MEQNDAFERILAAGEIGAFTVCPRAWKLKCVDRVDRHGLEAEQREGADLHRRWSKAYDEAMRLTTGVRHFVALVCAAIVAFMFARSPQAALKELFSPFTSPGFLELVTIVLVSLVIAEIVHRAARRQKEGSGLGTEQATVRIDGSELHPVKNYISKDLRLAGRPDAVIEESGYAVPVERKPLARKLRDRYVAQLLVYMRLIEIFEKKIVPHGYLVLGPTCRRVKIENSPQRQAWVDSLIADMRGILAGQPAKPLPQSKKCSKCDVRHACAEGTALVESIGRSSGVRSA